MVGSRRGQGRLRGGELAQPPGQGQRNARLDPGALGVVLLLLHPPVGVQPGHQVAAVIRDHHVHGGLGRNRQFGDPAAQALDAVTGGRGHEHRAGQGVPQLGQRHVAGGVGLVHHQQLGRRIAVMVGDDLGDHLVHGVDLGQRVDVGAVDDVHQQIGVDDLLQGGAERLDQLGGQVPDEADGVGEHERPAVVPFGAPGGGLKVANRASCTSTPAPVSALSRLDLPALV